MIWTGFLVISLIKRLTIAGYGPGQVTYGKGLLIDIQKLIFGAYFPDFTPWKNENWQNYATFGA